MTFFSILLILILLSINYYIYYKKITSKSLFIISSAFLILYSIITIAIYYNNINDGFVHGILFGDVSGSYFCDEERYFFESRMLYEHFLNGDFINWITGKLPKYEYITGADIPGFGYKNIFVIFLTFLRLLGIHNVINMILVKLIIYIPTSIFLYKLANLYLDEKKSLVTVTIFSLLPGYILTNTLLMRDNIILALLIIIFYYLLAKDFNIKKLLIPVVLLFILRGYLILILPAVLIFCYKNSDKIINLKDFVFLLIISFTLLFFSNFKFERDTILLLGFSSSQMSNLQNTLINNFGNNLSLVFNVFTQTIIHIIVDPIFPEFLRSGLLYLILFSLGNIIGTIISIIFIFKFIYTCIFNKNTTIIYLLKFTSYFTLLSGILVLCKDLFIINRVALMWLPLFIIILLIPKSNLKKTTDL